MRRFLACALVIGCCALLTPVAQAQTSSDRLILLPDDDTIVTVEGLYPQKPGECEHKQRKPLRARYRGRLDIVRDEDGSIKLINSLSFDHYLRGLAEVPLSWPPAALRAQIIAARTYALHGMRRDRDEAAERGYDICSTDQCQVYRGATVELGAFGERWVEAVGRTRGQVLTYNGNVVQTFYFSTSDGRTRSSFPGGTAQPWLPSVDGEDDDAPLSRWTARIRLSHLSRILRAADRWNGGSIEQVRVDGGDIVVAGGGDSTRIRLDRFRFAVNQEAPCLYPDTYPARKGSSIGTRLPQTIPSTSFRLRRDGNVVVFRGRGWGHFVGMSQWGARSLAERGRSARQILRHFYGPARIDETNEPGRIRVLAAENLRLMRISVDGRVRVRTGTGSRLRSADAFEVRGGKALRIRRGRGPSLEPVLTVTPGVRELDAAPGARVKVPFEASRPVRVRTEILREQAVVARTRERSLEHGLNTLTLALDADTGGPLPPGAYEIVIEAFDGLDRVRSEPVALSVVAPSPSPVARPDAGEAPRGARTAAIAIAALALAVAVGLLVRARMMRARTQR